MVLESLRLVDFRNFRELDAEFDARPSVIWGANGRGKTNLLESIFLLGTTRSHRTRRDAEMVRFGTRAFSVAGEFVREGGTRTAVALVYEEELGKRASIDRKRVDRLSGIVGKCSVVFVSAEDVEIARGEPERRRHFINVSLCTLSSSYMRALREYHRVRRHRGRILLEEGGAAPGRMLDTWDRALARSALPLFAMRRAWIAETAAIAEEAYADLGAGEKLAVGYLPGAGEKATGSEEELAAALRENRRRDRKSGRTSVGPHRDDMEIFLDGKRMRAFGSRGQQWTAVLALKIASGRAMKRRLGEDPVLLLDDVFPELDEGRSVALAAALRREGQIFATGTERGALEKYFPDARRFSMPEGGKLVREG